MSNETILVAKDLVKRYDVYALSGLNITVPSGKIIGLLGPNGSGKTTFIKLAAGLLKSTSGELLIGEYPPGVETKNIVSYLPERNALPLHLTPSEVITYYTTFFSDFDAERAFTMLNDLEVPLDRKIKSLSKGTKEKVQLVMTMSRRALLYLLDEPIGGVDPAVRDYILNTIITNRNPEAAIIISTHLIADIEPILDEFVFIRNGKVVRAGSVKTVAEHTGKTLDQLFREDFRC